MTKLAVEYKSICNGYPCTNYELTNNVDFRANNFIFTRNRLDGIKEVVSIPLCQLKRISLYTDEMGRFNKQINEEW